MMDLFRHKGTSPGAVSCSRLVSAVFMREPRCSKFHSWGPGVWRLVAMTPVGELEISYPQLQEA